MPNLDEEIAQRMKDKYDPELEQKALDWIGAITKRQVPEVRGKDGDALYEWLKDGVILCDLLNAIKPNTVPPSKITRNPRHHLEERENINLYLAGCTKLGIPSQDMCLLSDLHSQRSISAVLGNIYALGRQAQVISTFDGPRLGVKYTVSIEEQMRRAKKKEEERQRVIQHRRMKSDSQLRRRNELEEEMRSETLKELEEREQRTHKRRLSKGRISLADFRQLSQGSLEKFKQLKDSKTDISSMVPGSGAVKYGMDREIAQKRKENYSNEKEEQVMDWIEAISGKPVNNFYDDLRDGIVLCELLNAIRPGLIRRVNKRDVAISHRDNLQLYLSACVRIGVPNNSLFTINDLYEQNDLSAVVNHFFALSRRVEILNLIPGPYLEIDGRLSTPSSPRDHHVMAPVRRIASDTEATEKKKGPVEHLRATERTWSDPGRSENTPSPSLKDSDVELHDEELPQDIEDDQSSVESMIARDEEDEFDERYYSVSFPHTSYWTMLTPRFWVHSLFTSIMSLRFAFCRG